MKLFVGGTAKRLLNLGKEVVVIAVTNGGKSNMITR
jgi:LmbE family N-acetylglucosaminyl deacetylase